MLLAGQPLNGIRLLPPRRFASMEALQFWSIAKVMDE
jgi:hypothetical protein